VIVDVPNAEGVAAQLLNRNVIIDYRPGAGIRIAPHFYNTEGDVDTAMDTIDELVAEAERAGGVSVAPEAR
jgi:kynureninase